MELRGRRRAKKPQSGFISRQYHSTSPGKYPVGGERKNSEIRPFPAALDLEGSSMTAAGGRGGAAGQSHETRAKTMGYVLSKRTNMDKMHKKQTGNSNPIHS